jgi:hypothetical protein
MPSAWLGKTGTFRSEGRRYGVEWIKPLLCQEFD